MEKITKEISDVIQDQIRAEFKKLKEIALISVKDALTIDDVCLLTNLSKSYVYKLCTTHKIPHYKSDGGNKLTYFDRDEIKKWCLAHRIATNDEVVANAVNYIKTKKKQK